MGYDKLTLTDVLLAIILAPVAVAAIWLLVTAALLLGPGPTVLGGR